MNINNLFRSARGYFCEKDLIPLDVSHINFKKLGYKNFKNFKETIKPFKIENIFQTNNMIYPYIYADCENSIHAEMLDLSKQAIETFVCPAKRVDYIESLKKDNKYLSLYVSMFSPMLALDFITNYKKIPKEQLKGIFLYIYQSRDYNFDVFPREVISDVFKLIKSTSNNSEKLIKIYRGMETQSTPLKDAWSWTTKRAVAKQFATRWKTGKGKIYEGYIKEKDIIYSENLGEYEVLCFYDDIIDIQESVDNILYADFENFKSIYDKEYKSYSCYIDRDLFHPGDHDCNHSLRVLFWTVVLGNQLGLEENERKILAQSSLLHDIGRMHDWDDEEHGKRAVDKILKEEFNPLNLSTEDLAVSNEIIKNHCIDDENIKADNNIMKLIKIFKDCDALDRVRFNDLDENYLRFPESKELIDYADMLLSYV